MSSSISIVAVFALPWRGVAGGGWARPTCCCALAVAAKTLKAWCVMRLAFVAILALQK